MHKEFLTIDRNKNHYENYLDLLDIPLNTESEYMISSRILLLEADPAVQYTRSRLLVKEQFAVTIASDFNEAVNAAKKESFDLIILNVESPELLYMSIAQFPPSVPILMIAEKSIAVDLLDLNRGWMQTYLFTPFSNTKFKNAVNQAINSSRMIKESIRNEVLISLSGANHNLAIGSGIDKFMENVAKIALDGTSADYVSLTVNSTESGQVLTRAEKGKFSPSWNNIIKGLDVITEPVVICKERSNDSELIESMNKSGISSLIFVPLISKGKIVGSIVEIKKKRRGSFADSDLNLTSILAWWTSMAIDNTQIYLDYFKEHLHADRLLDHISFAQENERKRVAVEIHDGVAQWLVGASYDVKLCSRLISEANFSELEYTIEKIRGVLQKSVKELRRAISNLPLPPLEEIGLDGVIVKLGERLTEEGIRCRVDVPDELPKLTIAQQKTFYWLIQESITNIRKHAKATCVDIRLYREGDNVTLNVFDNGVGFDVGKAMESKLSLEHIGLYGMRERAEFLNGFLDIDSEPGKGTSVNFSFSLLPPEIVSIART